jgi:hypothetical protein
MRRAVGASLVAALAAAGARPATAQSVAGRVDAVRDGMVHFSFAPKPGVCGDGNGSMWYQRPDDDKTFNRGYMCMRGPVRVAVGRSEGQTVSVRSCVACRRMSSSGPDVDLGEVSPAEAARYLMNVARTTGGRTSNEALGTATLADSVNLTPELISLARDGNATLSARRSAMFWLGQAHDPQALKFFREVLTP